MEDMSPLRLSLQSSGIGSLSPRRTTESRTSCFEISPPAQATPSGSVPEYNAEAGRPPYLLNIQSEEGALEWRFKHFRAIQHRPYRLPLAGEAKKFLQSTPLRLAGRRITATGSTAEILSLARIRRLSGHHDNRTLLLFTSRCATASWRYAKAWATSLAIKEMSGWHVLRAANES